MTQQLRKLSFASNAPSENVLFVDSDVVFIRPFEPGSLSCEGKIPLFEIDHRTKESLGWANQARGLFGLPQRANSMGYVHPTFWRRAVVKQMVAAIEQGSGRSWQETLARLPTLSEYNLYGIFVREVIGLENAGVYPFNEPLMHTSWHHDLSNPAGVRAFFDSVEDRNVAVMVHSKDGVSVQNYVPLVHALWNRSH